MKTVSVIVVISSTNELQSREINLLSEESEPSMKLDHKRPRRKETWSHFGLIGTGKASAS